MEGKSELVERTGNVQFSRVVMGKLRHGVDLLAAIKELARVEGIQAGVILSGLGALSEAVFRNLKVMPPDFKIEDKHRLFIHMKQSLELVSLTGWIAQKEDGELDVHAHFATSAVIGEEIVMLGGHLTTGTITSVKAVVTIGVIDDPQVRSRMDPQINQTEIFFALGRHS